MDRPLESETAEQRKLRDGRDPGEWISSYPLRAQIQIYVELAYLLSLLILALCALGLATHSALDDVANPLTRYHPFGRRIDVLYWISTFLAGLIGGLLFTLKWHYHCVAKRIWHQDRLVWRITAPILSGVLALFVVMMVRSELVPFINASKLDSLLGVVSFAFFLGLFSDNLLAALQNFAARTFGTLRDRNQKDVRADASAEQHASND